MPNAFRRFSRALVCGIKIKVSQDLAAKVRPCDLIDVVEAAESQRLASLLERDLGQMARLVSFLMDKPQLYELEGMVFEDRLEITMYDRDVPKPISHLSKGQMATALLPLILRPASYPLVFDQPEDDLDNSFIYETLVRQIQSLRTIVSSSSSPIMRTSPCSAMPIPSSSWRCRPQRRLQSPRLVPWMT